jgi:hypothetical protein
LRWIGVPARAGVCSLGFTKNVLERKKHNDNRANSSTEMVKEYYCRIEINSHIIEIGILMDYYSGITIITSKEGKEQR